MASHTADLEEWAVPRLTTLLPLDPQELKQIVSYADTLTDSEAAQHLREMLGDSPDAVSFISAFNEHRSDLRKGAAKQAAEVNHGMSANGPAVPTNSKPPVYAPPPGPPPGGYAPPPGPPPSGNYTAPPPGPPPSSNYTAPPPGSPPRDVKQPPPAPAPAYNGPPPASSRAPQQHRHHTNAVIEAGKVRARDEQEMQQALQNLQYKYRIYNDDIEPEHETEYYCNCPIHAYQARKYQRLGVQEMWSRAVMYPGEKSYNDNPYNSGVFSSNPYKFRVVSPYGYGGFGNSRWAGIQRPIPSYHAKSIHQTIDLNNALNRESQANVNAREPKHSIWDESALDNAMVNLALGDKKQPFRQPGDEKNRDEKVALEKRKSMVGSINEGKDSSKPSKMAGFRKSLGIKTSEERAVAKVEKAIDEGKGLRNDILAEENGRWQDDITRNIVFAYQEKVGMTKKIAELRMTCPIQYAHLLRAGYFEPIPVAWATQASNPLKFAIEASSGWRGITPNWRGYEDTAEERLYWVLNHREGSVGRRLKPDPISEMNMARERLAKAVEPPPLYFDDQDVCHTQHTSPGYSKQVMPSPFRPADRPEKATDDTMILLDVSGSMDFDSVRPIYDQYMVTGWAKSTQPKNKDVAKAIVRRFADAMANHDQNFKGYDLVTFANSANYVGTINHQNLETMWRQVRIGGGTRVMTGWQKIKELHFQKHAESATHHPIFGWQAGPDTPMLRLLLLLDGECTDMDEFEMDLLSLSWAHVTIFLVGAEGCIHHNIHANQLSRISDVNHHVSFVDAQGNTPERFVTHELLKRHLGYDMSYQEFQQVEELPAYSAT